MRRRVLVISAGLLLALSSSYIEAMRCTLSILRTCTYHVGSEHRNVEAVSQQVSVILLARSSSYLMVPPTEVKPLDAKSIPTVEGGKRVSFTTRRPNQARRMMDVFMIKSMTSISFQRANASTSAIVRVSLCGGHPSSSADTCQDSCTVGHEHQVKESA